MFSGLRGKQGQDPKGVEDPSEAQASAQEAAADAQQLRKQAGSSPASYGATATADADAKAAVKGQRVFCWEERGYPWQLLITAGSLVGRQYAALALICLEVFFMGTRQHKYLMSCNPRKIGMGAALFCEYSKTCVRCFPLMAMVVTLVVAARLILNQRAFYLLLRRGVLVDFDNFSPLHDPLFWILLWTLASAFAHFIFDMVLSGTLVEDVRAFDSRGIILFYFAPVCYFLMFLYSSYDIEELLLPLSKYWEEDPEWARRSSQKMVFVDEHTMAKAVMRKGLRLEPDEDEAPEPEPGTAASGTATAVQRFLDEERAAGEAGREDPDGDFSLSRWRHISVMWASLLLLDARQHDEASRHFRMMWMVFTSLSLVAMLLAFVFFGYQIYKDIGDIFWPPWENTDIPSLVVEFLYFCFTGGIAYSFWKNLVGNKG